jgi:hypothetical protein
MDQGSKQAIFIFEKDNCLSDNEAVQTKIKGYAVYQSSTGVMGAHKPIDVCPVV